MTEKQYAKLVEEFSPKSPLWKDCLWAFSVGGAICCLGQALMTLYGIWLDKDMQEGFLFSAETCERIKRRCQIILIIGTNHITDFRNIFIQFIDFHTMTAKIFLLGSI